MLTMTREQLDGAYFVVLTPDDPAFPPVAIECTGALAQGALAWNIHTMSKNVLYPQAPDAYKVERKP